MLVADKEANDRMGPRRTGWRTYRITVPVLTQSASFSLFFEHARGKFACRVVSFPLRCAKPTVTLYEQLLRQLAFPTPGVLRNQGLPFAVSRKGLARPLRFILKANGESASVLLLLAYVNVPNG